MTPNELLRDNWKNNIFIPTSPRALQDKTHVPESTTSRETTIMADTCYFVGIGDRIFLVPDAPVITLTPELICSTSVITVHIYTEIMRINHQKVIVSKTLKDIEEMLEGYSFFRIHQSWLINLKFLQKYVKGDGGHVIMKDGTSLDVSRRQKRRIFIAY